MFWKIVLTFVPALVIAMTQTNAISEMSSAYSSRSCPCSSRASPRTFVITDMTSPRLRCRRKRRRDVLEDLVDVRARAGDRDDADQRDQRDEQRVLEQVLP